MDKRTLRQWMIDKRNNLSIDYKKQADQIISKHVIEFVKNYKCIGLFCSFNNEIDTYNIIYNLWNMNKIVVVPKIHNKEIEFYQIDNMSQLEANHLGILEPITHKKINKNEIDILIIPLLAYNNHLYRLGYGGGYYDRYLQDYVGVKLGIAYSFQKVEIAFQKYYDQPCDLIINERGKEYEQETGESI